ncbi:hypothetical protein SAMN04488007_3459 [Maribacter aquivivus]|uniref:Uncharacterized protein n=1 Tax=Maribacter aquivivus TaxID=228958 RepID=A0A1M6U2P1_9FLAO|nr:hypothetical protein [Maribacter aquivivus]SHK63429.1 hypothetical protein SAMN04488007_3459 [Maribacter aquivivus]
MKNKYNFFKLLKITIGITLIICSLIPFIEIVLAIIDSENKKVRIFAYTLYPNSAISNLPFLAAAFAISGALILSRIGEK